MYNDAVGRSGRFDEAERFQGGSRILETRTTVCLLVLRCLIVSDHVKLQTERRLGNFNYSGPFNYWRQKRIRRRTTLLQLHAAIKTWDNCRTIPAPRDINFVSCSRFAVNGLISVADLYSVPNSDTYVSIRVIKLGNAPRSVTTTVDSALASRISVDGRLQVPGVAVSPVEIAHATLINIVIEHDQAKTKQPAVLPSTVEPSLLSARYALSILEWWLRKTKRRTEKKRGNYAKNTQTRFVLSYSRCLFSLLDAGRTQGQNYRPFSLTRRDRFNASCV